MKNLGNIVKTGVLTASAIGLLVVAACSSNTAGSSAPQQPSGRIRPVTITASVAGNSALAIPTSTVTANWNSRFAVATPGGQEMFMAYVYNGTTYVRASICPPCGSQSFSLIGDTLVCAVCGTVFYAQSGAWKVGPCRFPKQPVAFTVNGDNIVMNNTDLLAAYNKTRNP